MALETKSYTLGKGEIYFEQAGTGERYIGNSTEFNITIESENLDHFDSDNGIRVKDDSVVLEITRTGSLITDNMSKENLALFFLGDISTVTQTATPVVAGPLASSAVKGYFYQIGKSTANPQGVRGVTGVAVKKGATSLVLDTDYTLDAALGRVRILETSVTVLAGDVLTVDYTPAANTRERISTSNSASLDGSIRFVAKNPKGTQRDIYIPKVTLRPTGDFATKGDDWQQVGFAVEIGQNEGQSAIYIDGRPA
jgi:hypothetical protein